MNQHFANLIVIASLAGYLTVSGSGPASASVVVFDCSGTITRITNPDFTGSAFDSSVQPGVPFRATFRIDAAAEDIPLSNQDDWGYTDHDTAHTARAGFGNYLLGPDASAAARNIMAGRYSDRTDNMRWGSDNTAGSGLTDTILIATLTDSTGTALTGKGLPPIGPGVSDISWWDNRTMAVIASNAATGARSSWTGSIGRISTHIESDAVPEPSSLALLAGSLLPLLGLRRRK